MQTIDDSLWRWEIQDGVSHRYARLSRARAPLALVVADAPCLLITCAGSAHLLAFASALCRVSENLHISSHVSSRIIIRVCFRSGNLSSDARLRKRGKTGFTTYIELLTLPPMAHGQAPPMATHSQTHGLGICDAGNTYSPSNQLRLAEEAGRRGFR